MISRSNRAVLDLFLLTSLGRHLLISVTPSLDQEPDNAKQLNIIIVNALKGEERLIYRLVDGLDEYQGDLRGLL